MKKCLVIGATMLDIIMKIEHLPKTGEDVSVKGQEMTVGGCAYNVAEIMARFHGNYTLFAPIGSGMYADYIEKILTINNQKSVIKSTKMDNGYCLCMVEQGGERTFLTLPGIECSFEKEWFSKLNMNEYESIYVSGYELEGEGGGIIIDFLEEYSNLMIYYAPGPRIANIEEDKTRRLNKLSPVIHLNEGEALMATNTKSVEEAARKLQEATENTVIVTMGEKGAYLLEEKHGTMIPSKSVKVVDTIGAGDSHIGAIIATRQLGDSFQDAVKVANQVSALVVGVNGPTVSQEQIDKVLTNFKWV